MSLILQAVAMRQDQFELEASATIENEVTVLFGPSGAGKTTLLDVIAGLKRPDRGKVMLAGEVLAAPADRTFVPPQRRRIGYVPQDLALFPHLSVRRNLLYGYKGRSEGSFEYGHVTDLMELGGVIERDVTSISGGEKQRVALARALLSSPRLLLLDEPLANLDLSLKKRILPYLRRIREEFKIPIVYITHDQYELGQIADSIVVLIHGKIVQTGRANEVLQRPGSPAVAELLHPENAFKALSGTE